MNLRALTLALLLLAAPLLLESFYLGELALVFIYAIAGIGFSSKFTIGHSGFFEYGGQFITNIGRQILPELITYHDQITEVGVVGYTDIVLHLVEFF